MQKLIWEEEWLITVEKIEIVVTAKVEEEFDYLKENKDRILKQIRKRGLVFLLDQYEKVHI